MSRIKANKIKLNTINLEDDGSGTLQQVPGTDGTGPSNSEVDQVEYFVLSPTDISNKYVDLSTIPDDASKVRLYVIAGTAQQKGVDFDIVVNTPGSDLKRLTWDGLPLDGVLISGDVLLVVYNIITNISGPSYAGSIQVVTTGFNKVLSPTDTDVQTALSTLDEHTHASNTVATNTAYSGNLSSLSNPDTLDNALSLVDGFSSSTLPVNTASFNNNLVATDNTIQSGLLRLDKLAANEVRVVQAGHGFSVLDPIRLSGSVWVKAQGNTFTNAEKTFVVKEWISANEFVATSAGRIRTAAPHGLTIGATYYLNPASLGTYTNTKPVGTVNQPLGFHRPLFFVEGSSVVNVIACPSPILDTIVAVGHNPSGNLLEFINFDINNYSDHFKIELMASACIGNVFLRLNGSAYNWYGSQYRPDTSTDGSSVKMYQHNVTDMDFSVAQGTGLAGVYFWDTSLKIDLSIVNQRVLVSSNGLVGYNSAPAISRTELISAPNINTITSLRVSYDQNGGGGIISARILRG